MSLRTNITMLTYGRESLTDQALRTLAQHTNPAQYQLTTFNDEARLGTGAARNEVIRLASEAGRGDLLYLSDNDVCFQPHWLETLLESYQYARSELGVVALGACCHPYNQPRTLHPFYSTHLGRVIEIGIVDALPLQSWLWTWEDWERYGPFDQTPVGRVRMSEDFAVSQKIRADGKRVAAIYPPLVVNCGRTDSFGEPIPGAELIPDVEGVIVT